MIELRTLGHIRLTGGEGTDPDALLAQPKRFALFCYLALPKPGTLRRRDTLLGVFWPASDQKHARTDLRQALAFIRRALGENVLIRQGDQEVGLNPEQVKCDAAALQEAFEAGHWEEAVELYSGKLLPGVFLSHEPEFEKWLDVERARLGSEYETALEEMADAEVAVGDALRAVELCQLLVRHDQYNSRHAMRLMRAFVAAGDPGNALLHARRHAELLRDELGVALPPELVALVERIQGARVEEESARATRPEEGKEPRKPKSITRPLVKLGRGISRKGIWSAAIIGIAAAAAVGGRIVISDEDLPRERVAVLPLENRTGDESLDAIGLIVADHVTHGLIEIGLLQVIPTVSVLQAGTVAVDGGSAADNAADIFEWARALSAGTVVHGRYTLHGDSLAFRVDICDVETETLVVPLDLTYAQTSDPIAGIGAAAEAVQGALAAVFDPIFPAVVGRAARTQLPSYEAYLAFTRGMILVARGDLPEAAEYLKLAAERDTLLVQARILSAVVELMLRRYASADSLARSAAFTRDRLGAVDHLSLDWLRGRLDGDYSRALIAARELARQVPGTAWHFTVALEATALNRPAEALEICRVFSDERAFIRNWPVYWRIAAHAHHLAGDHGRELEVARRAAGQFPHPSASFLEVRALIALGRLEETAELLTNGAPLSPLLGPTGPQAMMYAAAELRAHGYPESAEEVVDRLLESLSPESSVDADGWSHRYSVAEAFYLAGRWEEAADSFQALAADSADNLNVRGYRAVLAARSGDTLQARQGSRWLRDLETPFLFGANTYWRARIAAQLGELDESVALLRAALAEGLRLLTNSPHLGIHMERDFEPLHDHPGFRELIRPKG